MHTQALNLSAASTAFASVYMLARKSKWVGPVNLKNPKYVNMSIHLIIAVLGFLLFRATVQQKGVCFEEHQHDFSFKLVLMSIFMSNALICAKGCKPQMLLMGFAASYLSFAYMIALMDLKCQ